jgi:hypothetical protein
MVYGRTQEIIELKLIHKDRQTDKEKELLKRVKK